MPARIGEAPPLLLFSPAGSSGALLCVHVFAYVCDKAAEAAYNVKMHWTSWNRLRAAELGPLGVLGQARSLSYARNLTPYSLTPKEQCSAPWRSFSIWSKTL